MIHDNTWPKHWKMGEWIPVHKKDDPQDKTNYRPITILAAVDKVFEQLLCQQLNAKFEHIFDSFMSAYRKHYSCETTLVRLVEDWKKGMDDGCTSAILSTDMSKAFDSLHPTLLLAKLKAYGLSQSALNLMSSYFSGRENRTRLGPITSDWAETKRGCPQGSSLGPLLWNIYQNDFFYAERKSNFSMYADDHQIYCSDKIPEHAIRELKNDGKNASK